MKLYTSKEAAEFLNVALSTIIRWDNEGRIRSLRTPGGHRRFTEEELRRIIGMQAAPRSQRPRAVLYARISNQELSDLAETTSRSEDPLNEQMERLRGRALAQGYKIVAELSETASGINESRPKLHRLLQLVSDGEVDVVVIEYRDRLSRFGYRYLERYVTDFGARIEVLEDQVVDGSTHEELVQDLIAIVTSFSARIYGVQGANVVEKMKEALQEEAALGVGAH